MRKSFLKYLLVNTLSLACFSAYAQVNTISPYSNFGIGELSKVSTSRYVDMGGIGIGSFNDQYINLANPASYGNLSITNFEIGLNGSAVRLSQGDLTQEENFGNFSHLVFASPLGEKWGISFGLVPLSNIGYEAVNDDFDPIITTNADTVDYKLIYEGEGGLNKAFAGVSYDVNDKFSVGLNFNFVYGQIESIRDERYDNSSFASTLRKQSISVQDVSYTLGAQYRHALSETRTLTAGLVYSPKADLAAEERLFTHSYVFTGSTSFLQDSLVDSKLQNDYITLPSELGIGFGMNELNKWSLGLDLKMTNWTEFSLLGREEEVFKDQISVAVGGSWTPNYKDIRSFFNRIEYRGGLHYSNGHLNLNPSLSAGNTDIAEFGINFGIGIPVRKNGSTLNLGVGVGQRGTDDKSLVKEEYFNFRVSYSLRDRWFIKRKID